MCNIIYLVRHCEIDYGKGKHYIGITDLPLSEKGKTRARGLKEYFLGIRIDKAYTSPLIRCIQTLSIILQDRDIHKVLIDELMEIDMGQWEGRSFEYIKSQFPEQFERRGAEMDTFVPPGGESFLMLQKRVMPAFNGITANEEGDILIVAHAGVNRVILSELLRVPLKRLMSFPQPYGCINRLSRNKKHQRWDHEIVY